MGCSLRIPVFFDVLVGYFYTSGFHALHKSLENTEKIRILIGISTNKETAQLIKKADEDEQLAIKFSHVEVKQQYESSVADELAGSEDNIKVELEKLF